MNYALVCFSRDTSEESGVLLHSSLVREFYSTEGVKIKKENTNQI